MSLTGATAWPGAPPSSLLEVPSSTVSTPRTTKTTTRNMSDKRRNLGLSALPIVHVVIGIFCQLHTAQPLTGKTKTNAYWLRLDWTGVLLFDTVNFLSQRLNSHIGQVPMSFLRRFGSKPRCEKEIQNQAGEKFWKRTSPIGLFCVPFKCNSSRSWIWAENPKGTDGVCDPIPAHIGGLITSHSEEGKDWCKVKPM